MDREEIYNYFILQAKLYQTIINWVRDIVKDTNYKNVPYRILNIAQLNGGSIGITLRFLVDNKEVEEVYSINIKDLENY